jgi:hypothetical protein
LTGRQTLPKAAWICASTPGRSTPGHVDLVDDDQAVALAPRRLLHHPHRDRLDAGHRADDHRGGLHRLQRGQALAEEIGGAGVSMKWTRLPHVRDGARWS